MQPCTTVLPTGAVGVRRLPALPVLLALEFAAGLAYALAR